MDGNPVEKTGFHGVDIQNILRGEFSRTDPELRSLYTYDAQGNLVEASENGTDYHYTHDTEGRVLSKRAWGKTLYENHYDAEGYRDSITEKDKVTNFVYQGGMLLHELDEDKNPARHYVLGNEYIGLDHNYYLTDEQGSVRYVLDAAGNVQNDYWYDAFGQCIAGHENIPNRLRYNAQIEDDLTGLYYLRARYYNTGIGRFTQEDVIYNDGLNLYAYCSSNPVMYADPSGYAGESVKQKTCGSKDGAENSKSGRATDFYVTPNGEVVPATGYRYMDSKYAEQTMESMSAPGSEPFTRCYPEYGKGGCQQFIYKGTIYFKNVDIIED